MKNLIFTITLNISIIFFAVLAMLGKEYGGIDEDSSYKAINIVLVSLSLFFIFSVYIFNPPPLRKINVLFYLLPFIIGVIYMIESPTSSYSLHYFTIFMAYSFPAIYIGTYIASCKNLISMAKWWDWIFVIITLGLIVALPKIIFTKNINLAGAGYQSISYIAAYAYSLTLSSLTFGNIYPRFTIFQNKLFKIVSIVFLFIQVISVFISGGRGGFLVVLFSSIVVLYVKFKNKISFKFIITLLFILFSFIILFPKLFPTEGFQLVQKGTERIFSYITSEGIDITQTSNRDILYSKALTMIGDRPIFGYGLYKYVDLFLDYPHNLFLELLLQGGIIFLIFWIYLFIVIFKKFKKIIKLDTVNILIIVIFIYPFTQLFFSNSYLMSPLFWFCIAYVFNYAVPSQKSL